MHRIPLKRRMKAKGRKCPARAILRRAFGPSFTRFVELNGREIGNIAQKAAYRVNLEYVHGEPRADLLKELRGAGCTVLMVQKTRGAWIVISPANGKTI